MRNFQLLDHVEINEQTGVITITKPDASELFPTVAMLQEGSYLSISSSYGPVEVALRLRLEAAQRTFARLQPVEGLQTTRQVGTGQAYLGLGLMSDGTLLMRPAIVADATGHLSFNLKLTDDVCQALYEWLGVKGVS